MSALTPKSYIMFRLFLSVFLFLSSTLVKASSPIESEKIQWHSWSDETFALAKQHNKLVLLDIGAQWCQFCKKMKAVTYQDPQVITIINTHYIAIKADIDQDDIVKKHYGTLGVPGTVILTNTQKELNKRLGYIAPQQMQWHLLGNLQDAPLTPNTPLTIGTQSDG